jgi:hypothetical protein
MIDTHMFNLFTYTTTTNYRKIIIVGWKVNVYQSPVCFGKRAFQERVLHRFLWIRLTKDTNVKFYLHVSPFEDDFLYSIYSWQGVKEPEKNPCDWVDKIKHLHKAKCILHEFVCVPWDRCTLLLLTWWRSKKAAASNSSFFFVVPVSFLPENKKRYILLDGERCCALLAIQAFITL